jgi:hypothetical protein
MVADFDYLHQFLFGHSPIRTKPPINSNFKIMPLSQMGTDVYVENENVVIPIMSAGI